MEVQSGIGREYIEIKQKFAESNEPKYLEVPMPKAYQKKLPYLTACDREGNFTWQNVPIETPEKRGDGSRKRMCKQPNEANSTGWAHSKANNEISYKECMKTRKFWRYRIAIHRGI
ncbi:hypothetical protein AB6A40_007137 [Gnathostoma spinigerum]|uniref:Uncharacterized protein n=1 Tax=Gnathostoma spinigerum TaxID=75299 RepID=A0ABD6ETR1_9BILA